MSADPKSGPGARDGTQDEGRHAAPWSAVGSSPVGTSEVADLIQRADAHDLGRSFLLEGAQDSVAATFGVHAFVVDAARAHLADTE